MGLIIFFLFLKPIKFQADSLLYDVRKKVLYLLKNVKIEYENVELFSDTVLFFEERKFIYAYGKAKLRSGKDSLKGEKIIYNTESQKGKVLKGKTKIEKGILWADKIYKVDKDNIKAFDGHYTTCELEDPHYFFSSKKVKVILKKDIVAEPVIMFIKDFPIIFLPFWIFPATKERKSGFLTPRPGRNSLLGLYLKNLTYYWAINPYMGYTIGFDLYEKKGASIVTEYEYILFKFLEGNISGTFTREIDPKRERWSINGIHNQNFLYKSKIQAKADFISDNTYATDYSEYKPERLKSEAYSYLTFSKNFKISYMNLTLDRREDFLNKKKETKLPIFSFSFFGREIGPFRISGGLNLLRIITKDSLKKIENKHLAINKSILTQQNFLGIFNTSISLNLSEKIYPEDTLRKKFPISYNISFSSNSSLTLYGRSLIKPPYFENFYHFLTISTGYSLRPGFKAIAVRGEGPKNPSSSLNFSLKNDFFAKKEKTRYPLININISGNYDFLKKEKKLSNINFVGTIPLPYNLSGSGDFNYNPYSKKIETSNFRISYNFNLILTEKMLPSNKNLITSGTYSYSKNKGKENHTLSGSFSGQLTEKWSFNYYFVYTSEEKKINSQSLNLTRDLHCFSLEIRWSKIGNFYDYQFRVSIKGIPDLKIERNFFETILPSLQE
ncbi:MAG: putative LPS assembly protein LptD [Candidatus Hydrothermales bacterium]